MIYTLKAIESDNELLSKSSAAADYLASSNVHGAALLKD
jgi:hypothetical protein